ncbi:hypothetical protein BGX38DRAFT_1167341 [Terfezia claveryi]|nr:hypothetical protein BGX38DRAFT_1167341 [Terfezia claveryi]
MFESKSLGLWMVQQLQLSVLMCISILMILRRAFGKITLRLKYTMLYVVQVHMKAQNGWESLVARL